MIPHFGYFEKSCQNYKVTFWGKNPLPVSLFTYYSLSCPFPKKLASHNLVLNKDDKVGNKTANKQERQSEKREQERKIEIDSQKKVQILAFAHA